MDIVEERVSDAGVAQDAGELRFPDALGEPCAFGALAKMVFQIIGEADDLFLLVLRRDADQDGFVETAANHFDLAALDQVTQLYKIFRAIIFEPLE